MNMDTRDGTIEQPPSLPPPPNQTGVHMLHRLQHPPPPPSDQNDGGRSDTIFRRGNNTTTDQVGKLSLERASNSISNKRKRGYETSRDDGDDQNSRTTFSQTMTTTNANVSIDASIDFHRQLVSAILDVGAQHASPTKIVGQMINLYKYKLKMEQIKSHLQRFRKVYDKDEKPAFLDEYDKFKDVIDRVDNHIRRPGSFALLDLGYVTGGRAAALVSHQVRSEYSDDILAHQYNILDQFTFVHSKLVKASWKTSEIRDEQEQKYLHQADDDANDQRTTDHDNADQNIAAAPTDNTNPRKKDPIDHQQHPGLRSAVLILAPSLTEEEKATPLGAALQQIVGLIHHYAEYLNEGRGMIEDDQNVDADFQDTNTEENDADEENSAYRQIEAVSNRIDTRTGEPLSLDEYLPAQRAGSTGSQSSLLKADEHTNWVSAPRRGRSFSFDKFEHLGDFDFDEQTDKKLEQLELLARTDRDGRGLDTIRRLVEENDRLKRENERLKDRRGNQQHQGEVGNQDAGLPSPSHFVDDSSSDDHSSASSTSSVDDDYLGRAFDVHASRILDRIPDPKLFPVVQRTHRSSCKQNDECSCCTMNSSRCSWDLSWAEAGPPKKDTTNKQQDAHHNERAKDSSGTSIRTRRISDMNSPVDQRQTKKSHSMPNISKIAKRFRLGDEVMAPASAALQVQNPIQDPTIFANDTPIQRGVGINHLQHSGGDQYLQGMMEGRQEQFTANAYNYAGGSISVQNPTSHATIGNVLQLGGSGSDVTDDNIQLLQAQQVMGQQSLVNPEQMMMQACNMNEFMAALLLQDQLQQMELQRLRRLSNELMAAQQPQQPQHHELAQAQVPHFGQVPTHVDVPVPPILPLFLAPQHRQRLTLGEDVNGNEINGNINTNHNDDDTIFGLGRFHPVDSGLSPAVRARVSRQNVHAGTVAGCSSGGFDNNINAGAGSGDNSAARGDEDGLDPLQL